MRPEPDILLPIASIEDETDQGLCVVFRDTGKRAWLPKGDLEYLPGAVVVPGWLAKKMGSRRDAPVKRTGRGFTGQAEAQRCETK